MKCNPSHYQWHKSIYSANHAPGFTDLLEIAYKAVNAIIIPDEITKGNRFKFGWLWSEGPSVLMVRTRARPVKFARQLVMYHLMQTKGGCKTIGKRFGFDHTTVLHSRREISNLSSLRYDCVEKDCLNEFNRLIQLHQQGIS
jgi:hypothetical protein